MRLKIGEFARLGMLSVSALRYYNEVGLLRPADVDPWTGYRYYTFDQLPALHRILALKDLGLSLEQIKHLMGAELPAEEIRGMLRLKEAELHDQAREIHGRLARVEARIQQIEMEGKMSDYEVVVKKLEPMRAAVLHDTIPNMDEVTPTFNRLFDEVGQFVSANGGVITGEPFDVWYDDPEERPTDMRVDVVYPTSSELPPHPRIKVEDYPGVGQAACVIHRGPFATLSQAYGALLGWIGSNGYRVAGPNREIYLQYERDGDQSQYVTEIQFPVERAV